MRSTGDRQPSALTQVRRAHRAGHVDFLIGVLEERGDIHARQSAAEYLGRMGDRRAVNPLIRTLETSDLILKNLAVKALARIGDEAAVPALLELAETASSPGVRVTAMSALGDLGDRRAVHMIARLILDDELARWTERPDAFPRTSVRRTRKWARRRLIELGASEVIPDLEAALPRVGLRERLRYRRLIRKLHR